LRRRSIVIFVAVVQCILLAGHWLVYETLTEFIIKPLQFGPLVASVTLWAFALLSASFVAASLLAWFYANQLVRAIYSLAAIWLALFNFLFFAACSCWAIYGTSRIFRWQLDGRLLAAISFSAALAAGIYGIVNAAWLRVKRVRVRLPGLPESWRGRVAALVSDTHLGHVRGAGFVRRIVALLNRAKPDIVFLAGDMYDGTAVNAEKLASPFREIVAPYGTYFVTGNHEEFRDPKQYIAAISKAGVRVLKNEKVTVDGLQVVGVFYHDSTWEPRLQEVLQAAAIDRTRASILITHEPRHLSVAEREGISLQVSGHTHGGQMIPWTRFAARMFGRFVHGLQRFGQMLVYTSYGAGTWGPPARVGTYAEIVLIEFE
jgi:uncharacterized protein